MEKISTKSKILLFGIPTVILGSLAAWLFIFRWKNFEDTNWIDGSLYTTGLLGTKQTFNHHLGLVYPSDPGYKINDVITIKKDDPNVNPGYDGQTKVLWVGPSKLDSSKWIVITDKFFNQSTTLEGGKTRIG